MTKHGIIICWSEDDRCFVAEVPELAGCMSDGPTPSAALEHVQTVAGEWIETTRGMGRPIPEPRGRLMYA